MNVDISRESTEDLFSIRAYLPGGSWIVQASDPQGALFALVGPKI